MTIRIPSRSLLLMLALFVAGGAWASSAKPRPRAATTLPDSAAAVALLSGVTNGACPLPGVVTGGQPAASHLAALAKAGFTTVLDLRTASEARGFDEAAAMRANKLRYELLPVTPASLDDATFDRFRALMKETGGKGVFVHCASGNRVGPLMIVWLVLDEGWSLERAIASARAGGLRGEELLAKARDYITRHPPKP